MSQDNIFREIDEDMERQRYEALWNRYGKYAIAFVVAIIAVTAVHTYWQSETLQQHQKATGDLAMLVNQAKDDNNKKISDLLAFSAENPGQTQGALAALGAAQLAARQGDKDKAVQIYDALSADTKAQPEFRQLADLYAVEVQLDTGDVAKLQERLKPLIGAKEAWNYSALEMSAYLDIRCGDKDKAKDIFTNLSQDAGAPPSLVARAGDMLRLLSE